MLRKGICSSRKTFSEHLISELSDFSRLAKNQNTESERKKLLPLKAFSSKEVEDTTKVKKKLSITIYSKTIVVFNSIFTSKLSIFAVLKIPRMHFISSGIFGWLTVAPCCCCCKNTKHRKSSSVFSLCTWSAMLYFKQYCLVLKTAL